MVLRISTALCARLQLRSVSFAGNLKHVEIRVKEAAYKAYIGRLFEYAYLLSGPSHSVRIKERWNAYSPVPQDMPWRSTIGSIVQQIRNLGLGPLSERCENFRLKLFFHRYTIIKLESRPRHICVRRITRTLV